MTRPGEALASTACMIRRVVAQTGIIMRAMLAVSFASGFVLVFMLLLPLVVIVQIRHWLRLSRQRYLRSPSELRIAVIGGGWTGLACSSRLLSLGVDVSAFEQLDNVGGTWHRSRLYNGLSLHSPIWNSSFPGFPYSQDQKELDQRVPGEAVEEYCRRFAAAKELRKHYCFSSRVTAVDQVAAGAVLWIQETTSGRVRTEGPFDLVIVTAVTTQPKMPRLPGSAEFRGEQLHSSAVDRTYLEQVCAAGKKVVVVGGSKSACDLVLGFTKASVPLCWVMRRPYVFFKYEHFFHDRTLLHTLRALVLEMAWCTAAILPRLGWLMVRVLGLPWTSCGRPHGSAAFRFGTLLSDERTCLRTIPQIIGEPKQLTATGLQFSDNQLIEADVIVWATGHSPGLETLAFSRNGESIALDLKQPLYQHLFVPSMKELAIAGHFLTAPGPLRGSDVAEMAVYHLCVCPPLDEQSKARSARRNWCQQPMDSILLFEPHFFVKWIRLQFDLVRLGVLDPLGITSLFLGMAVFGVVLRVTCVTCPSDCEMGLLAHVSSNPLAQAMHPAREPRFGYPSTTAQSPSAL